MKTFIATALVLIFGLVAISGQSPKAKKKGEHLLKDNYVVIPSDAPKVEDFKKAGIKNRINQLKVKQESKEKNLKATGKRVRKK